LETALHRRDLLKSLTAAVAFTSLQLPAAEPNAPLFFSKDDFALLDTLTEMIIPADEHSPGARAAGVAAYIDRTVAQAFLPEEKTSWTKGLALVNDLSRKMYDRPFLKTTAEQQKKILSTMAENEHDTKTEPERFFGQLKNTTAYVYYSSSIGIHQEIEYKGNVLLEQFAGYDAT
jgi:Gluconate 2-dehydrogenase subunit 3